MSVILTTFRPVPPGAIDYAEQSPIEVSSPAHGRRTRLSRRAASEYLYRGERAGERSALLGGTGPWESGRRHWFRRNWGWAAANYLASRRARLADGPMRLLDSFA
ncbi:hypothetical protein SAMN05421810_11213 [Amycolatopsis arida]|uniref:Uncharacterized protein n=1 Tax=Amycolatopsis arida TaxID=587909 RepID=A0A1I6ACR0_9PSEU|nr:hypothetical protein [Amycolatopsis arida]TDX97635.1 hypothetical protein CLV69_102739 [Amycolatopsis arida]SFQ66498.1 hypothetical protein SAMN05421810_11213 [Amycolatopsis arida]